MNRLLDIGFVQAGNWSLVDGSLQLNLIIHGEQQNVLYSFLEDGEIRYVGKTTKTLRRRMYGYWRPSSTQSTNSRINAKITASIKAGRDIEILVLPDSGLMHYGQFHLNLAAALEDSIIAKIKPSWNGGEKRKVSKPNPPQPVLGQFQFQLQPTYFDRGFFNVPVSGAHYLGQDGQTIDVFCGTSSRPIKALINRRANGNGTPRVLGGVELRQWFQANPQMATITVLVYSPIAIRLHVEASQAT